MIGIQGAVTNGNVYCLTIKLCLLLTAAAVRLIEADNWQGSDYGSILADGTIFEANSSAELNDSETIDDDNENDNNDEYGDTVATRDACEGYTCNFRSSCGMAPLNPLGRTRSAMEPFIINGEDQKYGEWPSFARIGMLFKDGLGNFCGGTLVSDKHILTAAHCVYREDVRMAKLEVWLGDHNTMIKDRHERVYRSRSQCVASGYIRTNARYRQIHDWAILTLKEPIQFSDYIQPACLPYGYTGRPNYRYCHLVGAGVAGFRSDGTGYTRPIIQKQLVRQVSCASASTIGSFVGPTQACYGKATSIGSTCFGDSGGPIICQEINTKRWTVVGVSATVHNNCDGRRWVAAYTRITTSLPKIKTECQI